jgi:phage shock protein PspC (stress-responsive transcriptional regulator)
MLFDLFVVQYVTLTLFCLSVMVSTVPAYLQNILIGTATRRNDQEWTNFKLHEPCEPQVLSSGVCVCCSIDPSSVRSLHVVFMCQNFIC